MSGVSSSSQVLNDTLENVSRILNRYNINDWFIMFGTLLGIARDESCIPGDDDIDIMINHNYHQLRGIFKEEGYTFSSEHGIKNPDTILKSNTTDNQCSFDLYICASHGQDFYSPWEKTWVRNVYSEASTKTYVQKAWRDVKLNLPYDYENKLTHMYGDWKTPVHGMKSPTGNDIP